jgi:hypothetical protein
VSTDDAEAVVFLAIGFAVIGSIVATLIVTALASLNDGEPRRGPR